MHIRRPVQPERRPLQKHITWERILQLQTLRWGIREQDYWVWKYVICTQNVGAGTACEYVDKKVKHDETEGASHRLTRLGKKRIGTF